MAVGSCRKDAQTAAQTEGLAAQAEAEAARIRAGLSDPREENCRRHAARPLVDHLTDFQNYLTAKGGTKNHAVKTRRRAEKVLTLAGARKIADVSLSKSLDALATLRNGGLSLETVNHHIRAVKGFSRWLWKDGRAREHALAHLATVNPEADRRRVRRAWPPRRPPPWFKPPRTGPVVMGLSGPDRAMLYRVALGSGFRAEELTSLTPTAFHLDSDPPQIVCAAGYTKNGHLAEQPIARPWRQPCGPG